MKISANTYWLLFFVVLFECDNFKHSCLKCNWTDCLNHNKGIVEFLNIFLFECILFSIIKQVLQHFLSCTFLYLCTSYEPHDGCTYLRGDYLLFLGTYVSYRIFVYILCFQCSVLWTFVWFFINFSLGVLCFVFTFWGFLLSIWNLLAHHVDCIIWDAFSERARVFLFMKGNIMNLLYERTQSVLEKNF